jgi:hypothetical protein
MIKYETRAIAIQPFDASNEPGLNDQLVPINRNMPRKVIDTNTNIAT